MNGGLKAILAVVVLGGAAMYYFSTLEHSGSGSDADLAVNDIDLKRVLDVTVDTIVEVDKQLQTSDQSQSAADQAFILLSSELQTAYNAVTPPFVEETIGVQPLADASLLAYSDLNANSTRDENEDGLFLIEVDGQNSRIVATSRQGAVDENRFSGTGIFAGFLLGSMLNRQSARGASAAVANKTPVTATQARARARAGSGSHTRGK